MTNDFLLITTFNVLILNILRAQICHFSVLLFPELSFFDCNQKCTNRALGASIVKFAVGVTFAKSDTLESAHFCATKKLIFPRKHWDNEPILTFRNATNLQKIWLPLFRVVTLHSQAC